MEVETIEKTVASFGLYELNLRSGELRKGGAPLRLQPRPTKLLMLLVRRAGKMVTREEVRAELWGDTFIEFDHALNTCVQQVRAALNDSADSPRYIETVPRRGYRFIYPVTVRNEEEPAQLVNAGAGGSGDAVPARRPWISWLVVLGVVVLAAATASIGWKFLFTDAPSAPGLRIRLVVLPFEELNRAAADEDFNAGLAEELVTHLGRLGSSDLAVVAVGRSASYEAGAIPAKADLARMGAEMRVQYALEGSVRRDGERARITARLVRISDLTQLWSQTFERSVEDTFELQNDVALRVAESLALKLLPGRMEEVARISTTNARAYELYLRARGADDQGTPAGLREAVSLYEQALKEDDKFALAYAGLAEAYVVLAERREMAPGEAIGRARTATAKVAELNAWLGDVSASVGAIRAFYDWDWQGAEPQFRRVLGENPSHALARRWYAQYLYSLGRLEEGLEQAQMAQELEPHSPLINWNVSMHYYYAQQPDQALALGEAMLSQAPASRFAHFTVGLAALQKGEHERAIAALHRAAELSGDNPAYLGALGHAYGIAGRAREAQGVIGRLGNAEKVRYVSPLEYALVHLGMGDHDAAFQRLEEALSARAIGLRYLKVDPRFFPLRSDPRLDELLRRMNFPRMNPVQP